MRGCNLRLNRRCSARETRWDPRHGQVQLVGTGGTATILGTMEAGY
jgi:hypothetical protein